MKKFYYAFLVCCIILGTALNAKAGSVCSVDTTNCVPAGFYGNVCPGTLPPAVAGVQYASASTVNSFTLPSSFDFDTDALGLGFGVITVSVDQVEMEVTGLPIGLVAVFNDADQTYSPDSQAAGCFQVVGVPCDKQDTFNVALNYTVTVTVPVIGQVVVPFPISVPFELALTSTFPDLDVTAGTKFLCPGAPGDTIVLHASSGFQSYVWTGGSTDDSLAVDTAGEYFVTATTVGGACDFTDSIEINDLNAVVTADTTICANHFLQLNASGGDNFNWFAASTLNSTTVANPVILRGLTSSFTYQVEVSNGFCADTASVTVTIDTTCVGACGNCAVQTTGCGGLLPTVCSPMPAAEGGIAYDESVTFYLPDTIAMADVLPIPIPIPGLPEKFAANEIFINVANLPAGFSWSCDQVGSNCRYNPSLDSTAQYGCIRICGTTCDPSGIYAQITAGIKLPQQIRDLLALSPVPLPIDSIVPLPIQGSGIEVTYDLELEIVANGPIELNPGDSVTLTATAGFGGYEWNDGSTDATLTVTEAGTYCVSTTDANGCVHEACQDVTVLSSVTDLDVDATLSIYPNPSTGVFTLTYSLKNAQNVTVEMFDLAGKALYSTTASGIRGENKTNISLNNAAKGIYFVKVTTENGTVNRKVSIK